MTSLHDQLIKCFSSVFLSIKEEDLDKLAIQNCPAWDSVAHITLTIKIEDSFDITLRAEDMDNLTSFDSILKYICDAKNSIKQ